MPCQTIFIQYLSDMKRRYSLLIILCGLLCLPLFSQENLNYQQPPEEILELVDVDLAPFVSITEDREYMLLIYRKAYKSIAELSETELRLGGLRINPQTSIGSRTRF